MRTWSKQPNKCAKPYALGRNDISDIVSSQMAQKDVLIRSLDQEDVAWLEENKPLGMSQTNFLKSIIAGHRLSGGNEQGSLFSEFTNPGATVFGTVPFRFIDLFAGIGGFRCGLTAVGGECVYSSEWDKYSAATYEAWYGERPDMRDVGEVEFEKIPDHDVLAAGFPCQPFSLAGVSKKNSLGRAHGFDDLGQGNLFFSILRAIDAKHPPVVFLENVKNLKSHDRGNTWKIIRTELEGRGYHVFHDVIDAAGWVPQHRERIFVVAFDKTVFGEHHEINFEFPAIPAGTQQLSTILDPAPDSKYMISDKLWSYLKAYAKKHREKGNGFGYGIADPSGVTRTMSARYHKDGSEILIEQRGFRNPRRLTPKEARHLLGFDDLVYAPMFGHEKGFPQVVSDTQAYRQCGNAVVPQVVEAVAKQIVKVMASAVLTTDAGCLLVGRSSRPKGDQQGGMALAGG